MKTRAKYCPSRLTFAELVSLNNKGAKLEYKGMEPVFEGNHTPLSGEQQSTSAIASPSWLGFLAVYPTADFWVTARRAGKGNFPWKTGFRTLN